MSCDRTFEISLLIDGELPAAETPAAVEHLLACFACNRFFRQGRALDAALLLAAAADEDTTAPAPAEVWRRIGAQLGRELRTAPVGPAAPLRRRSRWLQAAAAALLLVGGATAGWQLARQEPTGGPATAAVRALRAPFAAAADRSAPRPAGAMDEERFVAIARELLAADRRYRDAMAGVLVVADSSEPREGSTAESSWRDEDLRSLRPDGARLY